MGFDIDFTELQKRGIIKKKIEEKIEGKVNYSKDGFVDLTAPLNDNIAKEVSQSAGEGGGMFGFLENPQIKENGEQDSETIEKTGESNEEVSNIKVQIENIEYKLENLIERLGKLEDKLK